MNRCWLSGLDVRQSHRRPWFKSLGLLTFYLCLFLFLFFDKMYLRVQHNQIRYLITSRDSFSEKALLGGGFRSKGMGMGWCMQGQMFLSHIYNASVLCIHRTQCSP